MLVSATTSSVAHYADVLVPRRLDYPFTYRIPISLLGQIGIGSRVLVPFGPSTIEGVVVAFRIEPPGSSEGTAGTSPSLREIIQLLGDAAEALPPDLLDLTRLLAERYIAPWGQCLRMILPPPPPRRAPTRFVITEAGRAALQEPEGRNKPAGRVRLPAIARELLAMLNVKPKGASLPTLRKTIPGPVTATLTSLTRRGLLSEQAPEGGIRRSSRARRPSAETAGDGPALLSDQPAQSSAPFPDLSEAWGTLQAALEKPKHVTFLLQASADDRMDSFVRAAGLALTRQRSVLLIAPETARASAFFEQTHRLWGSRVAFWHGGLAPAARADLWRRIRSGSITVLVGTRSAVFTPMTSLGLLCVDEEDSPSLKEEQAPRYHAREVAWMRAQQANAVLLLGSSHPAVETLARNEVDRLPSLGAPAGRGSPPTIVTVDIRRQPYGTFLSEPMIAGIRAAIETRSGAVLFLNRKGFAPALQCRDCGQGLECRNCRVTLTFYRRAGLLTCHYCGASYPLPDACPSCHAVKLEPSGFGTEQLEEEVRRLFRDALILRLDGDTAGTPARAEAIRREAASGNVDILIGTQMLFQGSPLPLAGFVGLPYADAGLHRPDFRAAERTYHTILDAVGMARTGNDGGTVVLQTYLPTHHALAAVVSNNPGAFYEQELASRQALGYPPFAHLISLHISGKHEGRVRESAQKWAAMLAVATARSKDARGSITILGPIPAATARVRGRHRWQLLVKSTDGEMARQAIRSSFKSLEEGTRRGRGPSGIKFDVDVDPVEMW